MVIYIRDHIGGPDPSEFVSKNDQLTQLSSWKIPFFITFSWQGLKIFQLCDITVNMAKWVLSEWYTSWKWKWAVLVVLKKCRYTYVWTYPPSSSLLSIGPGKSVLASLLSNPGRTIHFLDYSFQGQVSPTWVFLCSWKMPCQQHCAVMALVSKEDVLLLAWRTRNLGG